MATNRGYLEGLDAILTAWLGAGQDLIVQLVDDSYEWSSSDTLADIVGELGPATPVAGVLSVVDARLITDDPLTTIAAVPAGPDDVAAVVLYVEGGPLLGYYATNAGRVQITVTPDGGGIDITWPDGLILSLGG